MAENNIIATNRQALRDFFIEKTFEAGIQLAGPEVKSLRAGKVNLKGSFGKIESGEAFIYNLHIGPYEYSRDDYDPLRPRKLLLKKSELEHIESSLTQQGRAFVPIKIYFKRGYAKLEMALARGKKLFDKREALKEKQIRKETDRELRQKRG